MNSPYMGDFKVTQTFHSAHDGLDLVGIDDKAIHSTVNGVVERAGWENPSNHSQGFGQYVRIKKDGSNDRYYYGHLSSISVSLGDRVLTTDVIGYEGSTGNSTGSHCHYCVRGNASKLDIKNVCEISGIPNALGIYNDGYVNSIPYVKYGVYSDNRWLPFVKNDSDYAGLRGNTIGGLKVVPSSGYVIYQAHTIEGGKWYPWVTNLDDYAGVINHRIDCIRAKYEGDSRFVLQTRVSGLNTNYFSWVTNDSDYAGIYGKPIDRVQMRIVRK